MEFETARNLVKGFLIAGVVCCLGALITQTNNSPVGFYLTYGSAGCILLCVFFAAVGLRCPYCGKRIIRNCLVVKSCPHCRRNLKTGMKAKHKKDR